MPTGAGYLGVCSALGTLPRHPSGARTAPAPRVPVSLYTPMSSASIPQHVVPAGPCPVLPSPALPCPFSRTATISQKHGNSRRLPTPGIGTVPWGQDGALATCGSCRTHHSQYQQGNGGLSTTPGHALPPALPQGRSPPFQGPGPPTECDCSMGRCSPGSPARSISLICCNSLEASRNKENNHQKPPQAPFTS